MGSFLLATVAVVASQNARQFRAFLELHFRDSTVAYARESAAGLMAMIEHLTSEVAVVMHSRDAFGERDFARLAERFVASNREIMAFQLVDAGPDGIPRNAVFAGSAAVSSTKYGDKDPAAVLRLLRESGPALGGTAVQGPRAPRTLLVDRKRETGVEALTIMIRFDVERGGDRTATWALLTIWKTRLLQTLPESDALEGALIGGDGRPLVATRGSDGGAFAGMFPAGCARRAWRGESPFGAGPTEPAEARPALRAFYHLRELGAALVLWQDTTAVRWSLDQLTLRSMLSAWILLLLAILASYFAASRTTRQLRRVTEATRRISEGDFKFRITAHSADEVGLLSQSVNEMAGRIEAQLNAEKEKVRLENEVKTARVVQEKFFPPSSIECGRLNISAQAHSASECGGDWWGHYTLREGLELILVADATGHGVSAALVTAMIYTACLGMTRRIDGEMEIAGFTQRLLAEVNSLFCAAGGGKTTLTLFAALFDSANGRMTYANSGHPFAILLPKDPNDERFTPPRRREADKEAPHRHAKLTGVRGVPIGFFADAKFGEAEVQLRPGDKVVFFTDGLIECPNPKGEPWGRRGLERTVLTLAKDDASGLTSGLIRAAFTHFDGAEINDDVTVVTVELTQSWSQTERSAA
jgi:serine phosphatase RsbU (regulator of sigma subunit)